VSDTERQIPDSPVYETERLRLRRPHQGDIPRMVELAGDYKIAATTLLLPHPYQTEHAEQFVEMIDNGWAQKNDFTFVLALKGNDALIGVMGLGPLTPWNRSEIGYWIGVPYWGQGYATEAACRVIQFGFETVGLNRIYAAHFAPNVASGRVMQKAGMTYEGTLRQNYLRFGTYYDGVMYAILREEWQANH
jgi:RimJ/RimL family protein N-acetyltransferase